MSSAQSQSNQLVVLNQGYVAQCLARQDLKRWWVADAVGVHKSTLRRWLEGSIERVREDRAHRLADVLGERYEHIVAENAAIGCNSNYAAPADRKVGTEQRKLDPVLPEIAA